MIIGIEATHANKFPRTGVENYCFEIIQALKNIIPSSDTVILYSATKLKNGLEILPSNWHVKIIRWPFKKMWTQVCLSKHFLTSRPDVFFAPGQLVPFICPKSTVVTVHDSAFRVFPQAYNFWGKQYLKLMNTLIIQRASQIITPSEFSMQELIHYYKADAKKIKVIPHGYASDTYYSFPSNKSAEQKKIETIYKKYLITKPFILSVGRLEEKKNTKRIVEAFSKIRETIDCQLVLVGNPGVGYKEIKNTINTSPYGVDIKELGYLPEEEVAVLFRKTLVFVFPSVYEGFGLPVLEAMASGTPVVTSLGSSLGEVGSSAVSYINPHNSNEIADAILKFITNKELRDQKINEGLERVKLFSWEKSAEETYAILKK